MNRIRECRKNAGVSQKYIAVSLGVKGPTVSEWETEKYPPTLKNALQLAKLLGVSTDYLFGNTDDPGSSVPRLSVLPTSATPEPSTTMSASEWEMIAIMRGLNGAGLEYLLNTARMCAGNPAMTKESSDASEI